MVKMRKASCSVPLVLALLAFLSCLFLAHGLYGLIELFGSPDISPEAMLLIFALCFLVLAAAVAGGSRKMLLSREGDLAAVVLSGGAQEVPTSTPDQEVAAEGRLPLRLADDEEMVMARRVDLQTEDYPPSGANGRHDPRNPH
jgi:hypothetical protein